MESAGAKGVGWGGGSSKKGGCTYVPVSFSDRADKKRTSLKPPKLPDLAAATPSSFQQSTPGSNISNTTAPFRRGSTFEASVVCAETNRQNVVLTVFTRSPRFHREDQILQCPSAAAKSPQAPRHTEYWPCERAIHDPRLCFTPGARAAAEH